MDDECYWQDDNTARIHDEMLREGEKAERESELDEHPLPADNQTETAQSWQALMDLVDKEEYLWNLLS